MTFHLDHDSIAFSEHCLTYAEKIKCILNILPETTKREGNLYDLLDPYYSSGKADQIWQQAQADLSNAITARLMEMVEQFERQMEENEEQVFSSEQQAHEAVLATDASPPLNLPALSPAQKFNLQKLERGLREIITAPLNLLALDTAQEFYLQKLERELREIVKHKPEVAVILCVELSRLLRHWEAGHCSASAENGADQSAR